MFFVKEIQRTFPQHSTIPEISFPIAPWAYDGSTVSNTTNIITATADEVVEGRGVMADLADVAEGGGGSPQMIMVMATPILQFQIICTY